MPDPRQPGISGLESLLWRLSGLFCLTIVNLLPSSVAAADFLPNAAAHIGTVIINGDAQFTTNPVVVLTLNAVNDGNGVAQMQFSNDELSWSTPEPYQTSKQWVLAPATYPPAMSTVLETVYVRFEDGAGQWSPAVSDSIVFARSALDVPNVADVWIAQQIPTNFDGTQPLGSQPNPYVVPTSQNEPQFDTLMHSLLTNYQSYVTQGTSSNSFPGPATNATVLTVHLGQGIYQTHGACRGWGDSLAWSPYSGWRLIGAGRDATMLRGVDHLTGYANELNVIGGYYGDVAVYDNLEVADLTIDANLHEGETNYQNRFSGCFVFGGSNIQIRRVRVKNFGTTIPGYESGGGICLANPGSTYGDFNAIIEDCEAVQAQVGNAYKSGMMGALGTYGADGNVRYFNNIAVRNCFVDGAAYDGDTLVNPMNYASNDRGRFGIGVGGCFDAVLENNLVQNVVDGYYCDATGLHDITIQENHFRNVFSGFTLSFGTGPTVTNRLTDTFRFDHNFVEVDPRLFPAGDNYGSTGRRWGFNQYCSTHNGGDYIYNHFEINSNVFQFTDGTPPQSQVTGYTGDFISFRSADVRSNAFLGLSGPIIWFNDPEYLEQQVDIVNTNRSVPLLLSQNTYQDGTVVEAYPPVLDATLPRPVVVAGSKVSFPAAAAMVTGVPSAASVDQGYFQWQTGIEDAGRYILGLWADTNRLLAPRYTLVTVLSALPDTDLHYFSEALVGYWKMNEVSGTTFQDSSGNGNPVDCSYGVTKDLLVLGQPGNAIGKRAVQFVNNSAIQDWRFAILNTNQELFNGFPSNFFSVVGRSTSLYHPFTLSFWFKVPSEPQNPQLLFSDEAHFVIWVTAGTNNRVLLSFATGQWAYLATPQTITVGAWHHVAFVYDGASDELFVDGALLAQEPVGQLADCSPSYIMVGGGMGMQSFVGSMCEMAIWNRPLSPVELSRVRSDQSSSEDPVPVPLPPSELSAQPGASNSVFLSWQDNSLNETGFVLQRSMDDSTFTTIATLPQNSTGFVDSLPNTNGTWFYRVAAINDLGSSDYSPVAILGPCNYVLDSSSTNVGAAAMTGAFGVEGTLGCPWVAQVCGSCDWIHTSSSGICPGIVAFSISSNLTSSPRTGTITVQGQIFTITQSEQVQPVKGTYTALIDVASNAPPAQSGLVTLTTTAKGSFTGTLQLGAKTYTLSGKLDIGGQARISLRRPNLPSLTVSLQVGPDDSDLVSGIVGNGTWSAGFSGARDVFDGQTTLAPQAGHYTMVIPGDPASQSLPDGDSFATLSVDKAGRIRLAGTLADGTPFSRAAVVMKGGGWSLYLPLYAGQGFVMGSLNFTSTGSDDISGQLTWTKLAISTARYFPTGFFLQTAATGSLYVHPPAGASVLPAGAAQLVLSGGDLTQTITNQMTLGVNNRATTLANTKIKLSFAPSSGLFLGSGVNPATGEKLSLGGVVLQKSNSGSGLFKGKTAIGNTYLGP